jgi:hypothetical protein
MPGEHDRRREEPMLAAHQSRMIIGAAEAREGVQAEGE